MKVQKRIPRRRRFLVIGGPVDRIRVSLRICGPHLDPNALTAQLRRRPSYSHRRGDPVDRTGRGSRPHGMWLLASRCDDDEVLDAHLRDIFGRLPSKRSLWKTLHSRCRVDVSVGVHLERWNRGFSLSSASMKTLAHRGIQIGFDVYGPGNTPIDVSAYLPGSRPQRK
jgi:hypothetical protein